MKTLKSLLMTTTLTLAAMVATDAPTYAQEIGRASCRERV